MGEEPIKTDKEDKIVDVADQQDVSISEAVVGQATKVDRHTSIASVIAVAVLIATGLITLGFITYNSPDAPPSESTGQNTGQQGELDTTSPVTESAIDREVEQIDRIIDEFDNDSDFDQSSLSDDNLGM